MKYEISQPIDIRFIKKNNRYKKDYILERYNYIASNLFDVFWYELCNFDSNFDNNFLRLEEDEEDEIEEYICFWIPCEKNWIITKKWDKYFEEKEKELKKIFEWYEDDIFRFYVKLDYTDWDIEEV